MHPELTVIVPVWGDYWQHVDALTKTLLDDGLSIEQIIFVANGEAFPASLMKRGHVCIRTAKTDIGSARNAGLDLVATRYVLFCDADDLPSHGAIDAMLEALQAQPEALLATGYNQRADGNIYPWPYAYMPQLAGHSRRLLLRQWSWNQMFAATGTIFRTRVLKEVGGFPAMELAEDGALMSLLCALGPIIFLDQPTRVYQIHRQGLCQCGHSYRTWRQAYHQQRIWLRKHRSLPWFLRKLTWAYAPVHAYNAHRLEKAARYDYG